LFPGAVMTVDAAAMYGFSINSVTYGFIPGTIAQYLAVGVLVRLSKASGGVIPIAIPLFITLFFNSGSIGLYANASGGYKAAIIISELFGFFEVLMITFGIFVLRGHSETINSSESFQFRTVFLGMFY
ncbi:PTS transporter subunit IIC, partial [Mycoplasmopsis synoviae]